MSEQRTLSSVAYDSWRKVTRREQFLQQMEAVIPWATIIAAPSSTKNATQTRDPSSRPAKGISGMSLQP